MKRKQFWIITTDRVRPVGDVSRDLAEAGFAADRVLEEVGCITGAADEKNLAKLRKVPGVVDVTPDAPVDIGPPNSPETW